MNYKEKVIALLSSQELSKEQKEKLENIFPELKESEDDDNERIRKAVIEMIHDTPGIECENYNVSKEDMLAWLEKQGEQPTGKVDTKFKVGDWITTTDEEGNVTTEKIIEFQGDKVRLIDINGFYSLWPKHELNYYHLWTIQDAKDGDVLVNSKGQPFIFSGKYNDRNSGNPIAYCGVNCQNKFKISNGAHWTNKSEVAPATKEQRDLLFQKMKEDGYEWDTEKKELRKMKEVNEDEMIKNDIIRVFKGEISFTSKETNEKYIAWLEKQGNKENEINKIKL